MTKKIFLGMSAMAMLFATSCQNDLDMPTAVGGEATVSFNVATPEIGTRAYGDGQTAKLLQYAVYDAAGNHLYELDGRTIMDNRTATVELQLTTGNTYNVIFWAAAEGAPYTFTSPTKAVTVDYANVTCNNENYDAFYTRKTIEVRGANTENVTLTRPFAQLNIGTADYEASRKAGFVPEQSTVKVSKIYSVLGLWDGEVSTPVSVEFKTANINRNEAFPVEGNEYIAMNYLLVPAAKETVEVEFGYGEGEFKTRTVGSVPVQRNYRTNIYGNLLTSEVDINVTIDPIFNEPAYTVFEAFENGGTVTLTEDIVIDRPLTVKAGVNAVLDLNGHSISCVESATGSFGLITNKGTLTIKDGKGNGKIQLKATENRGWNAYSSVISNSVGGKLIVEGGLIEHLGGTDMAYAIDNLTNGKGTYAETIINGGTIKSTYRAVRQFLNGVEAQNILTVNGGTIEGDNKSIWMQDPSAKANTGKLFVAADAQLKGDVYLFVTAGSTEWPVEVSIANAALQGSSQVLTGNVPAGYSVVEVDGYHTVINAEIDVVVNSADDLNSALADSAKDTILLGAGEYGTIVAKSNKTIIGSAKAKVDCVNLNGADNVTLRNITFDAATAKLGYDNKGNGKQYANIITGDNTNKSNKGSHNLVIDGCTFEGTFANGGAAIAFTDQSRSGGFSGNITIKNCTFDTKGSYYDIYGHYVGNGTNGYGDFVIENNTFKSARSQGLPVYLGRYASSTPVVVKGNRFETVSSLEDAVYVQDHSNYGVSVDASNNTFAN